MLSMQRRVTKVVASMQLLSPLVGEIDFKMNNTCHVKSPTLFLCFALLWPYHGLPSLVLVADASSRRLWGLARVI